MGQRDYDKLILNHYNEVALNWENSKSSTMENVFVRDAETSFIKDLIAKYSCQQRNNHQKNGDYAQGPRKEIFSILDVGCGNGYTLDTLSDHFPEFNFSGIENNISLLEIAKKTLSKKTISVFSGDIRDPENFLDAKVDILICQRVIINLLDENDQVLALNNLIDCVNRFGLLIFIEAFKAPLVNLNDARAEFELLSLKQACHNLYLNDKFFDHTNLEIYDNSRSNQLSTHYFISRVIHAAYLNATKKEFVRNSHFVNFFSQAFPEDVGSYSPIKFLSFRKI